MEGLLSTGPKPSSFTWMSRELEILLFLHSLTRLSQSYIFRLALDEVALLVADPPQ